MEKTKTKLVIVLPGGGIRGAFQLGYLKALSTYLKSNPHVEISYVFGCSIGALIAPLVVTDRLDVAEMFLKTIVTEPEKVLKPWGWYYKWLPITLKVLLFNGVYQRILGAQMVMNSLSAQERTLSEKRCSVVGLNLSQQREEWFSGTDLELGIDISTCLPLAVPPIEHPETGEIYVDGGMTEVIPVGQIHQRLEIIAREDADKNEKSQITILIVECMSNRPSGVTRARNTENKNGMSIIEIQDKIIGTSMNQIANYDLTKMKSDISELQKTIPNTINLVEIRPTTDIFDSALDFNKDKIEQAILNGQNAFSDFTQTN